MKNITPIFYAIIFTQLFSVQELSASCNWTCNIFNSKKRSASSDVPNSKIPAVQETKSEIKITLDAWKESMIADIYKLGKPDESQITAFQDKINTAIDAGFFLPEVNQMVRHQGSGISLLHACVSRKRINEKNEKQAYAKLLLEAGADPNIQYKNMGRAPLHFAAQGRDNQSAMLLIAHGANVNIHDANGLTPLYFAESVDEDEYNKNITPEEKEAVIQTLKNAGAKPVDYANIRYVSPWIRLYPDIAQQRSPSSCSTAF